jgi:hypothetical protein
VTFSQNEDGSLRFHGLTIFYHFSWCSINSCCTNDAAPQCRAASISCCTKVQHQFMLHNIMVQHYSCSINSCCTMSRVSVLVIHISTLAAILGLHLKCLTRNSSIIGRFSANLWFSSFSSTALFFALKEA